MHANYAKKNKKKNDTKNSRSNEEIIKWKEIGKNRYRHWIKNLSGKQKYHLQYITKLLFQKGPIASFHNINKTGKYTLYFFEFWRRTVIKLISKFNMPNPCYKLQQLYSS